MVTANQLMVVSGGLFVGCMGAFYIFQKAMTNTIKNSKAFKEAMEEVRNHRGAKELLGEPIRDGVCQFVRHKSKAGNEDKIQVTVAGPKSTGLVFFTTLLDDSKKLNVQSVHLQIGKDESRLLVVK